MVERASTAPGGHQLRSSSLCTRITHGSRPPRCYPTRKKHKCRLFHYPCSVQMTVPSLLPGVLKNSVETIVPRFPRKHVEVLVLSLVPISVRINLRCLQMGIGHPRSELASLAPIGGAHQSRRRGVERSGRRAALVPAGASARAVLVHRPDCHRPAPGDRSLELGEGWRHRKGPWS